MALGDTLKKKDGYVQPMYKEETRTALGGFFSLVVIPAAVVIYGIVFIIVFYAQGRGVLVTSTTKDLGSASFNMKLTCQNPGGCYFVTAGSTGGCPTTEFGTGSNSLQSPPSDDFCTDTGGGSPGRRLEFGEELNGKDVLEALDAGRTLSEPAVRTCETASCGSLLNDDFMCIYIDPDPINAAPNERPLCARARPLLVLPLGHRSEGRRLTPLLHTRDAAAGDGERRHSSGRQRAAAAAH